jgi:membrane-associated phospholipid phosphatase
VAVAALADGFFRADDALTVTLNAAARTTAASRGLVSGLARSLAGVEVVLMAWLAVAGRRRTAVRMLAAVSLVYVAGEALGIVWQRPRPFVQLSGVKALVPHTRGRSFPSRHAASGLAMALVGRRAHPTLGATMAGVAFLLGVSRVAAGLHYPTDVVGGALLGAAIARLLRE